MCNLLNFHITQNLLNMKTLQENKITMKYELKSNLSKNQLNLPIKLYKWLTKTKSTSFTKIVRICRRKQFYLLTIELKNSSKICKYVYIS